MAKRFAICKLCGAYKLVNYAELCKRCNNRKAAGSIVDEAAAARDAHHEAAMQDAAITAEKAEADAAKAAEAAEGAEGEAAKASFSFFVVPWRILSIAVVSFAVLLFLFSLGLKRYNRWIIAQAQLGNTRSKGRSKK